MAGSEQGEAESEQGQFARDLGDTLRKAREAQQLAIEEVARELRIGADALRALERNDFESLGPPVFAKGYLKQYGARLGLATGELAAEFDRLIGSSRIELAPSRTIRLRDDRQITTWVIGGLVLALIVTIILIWWFGQADSIPWLDSLLN